MLPLPVVQSSGTQGDAPRVVEVTFKGNRREYYVTGDDSLKPGDHVVVDAERGQDLGRVKTTGGVATKKCGGPGAVASARRVLRGAQPDEVQRLMVLRADEDRVRRKAREMVEQHNLKMKVTEAEWQWDRNKLTLYFTAERRVDFRQLVRDLARTFRTRIELKQIGVRDEAALLGGVGRCGRELCCSTWLREIKPISLQLAKDQNLSLNPAQISGTCGRLMCCLTYEHDAYLQARKRFPREGKLIRTSVGSEKVIGIDIWHDQVTLLDESRQRRTVPLAELKAEIDAARQQRPPGTGSGPGVSGAPEAETETGQDAAGEAGAAPSAATGQPPSSRRRRRRRSNGGGGAGG